jgi:hypothetical protein
VRLRFEMQTEKRSEFLEFGGSLSRQNADRLTVG